MSVKQLSFMEIKFNPEDGQDKDLQKCRQIQMTREQADSQISILYKKMGFSKIQGWKDKFQQKGDQYCNNPRILIFCIIIIVFLSIIVVYNVNQIKGSIINSMSFVSHPLNPQQATDIIHNTDTQSLQENKNKDSTKMNQPLQGLASNIFENERMEDQYPEQIQQIFVDNPLERNDEKNIAQDEQLLLQSGAFPIKIIKPTEQKQTVEFVFNSVFWMYEMANPNYLSELIFKNQQRFASLSNFTVTILSKESYHQYLSEERVQQLETIFRTLRQRMEKDISSNLRFHIDSIERRLILLSILYEKGGIIADDIVTLTENFDWIRQIKSNIYVNRGSQGAQPRVVGFYSLFQSSQSQKLRKMQQQGMEEVERYMILIPIMEDYFIAAEKNSEFIGRLIEEILSILKNPKQIRMNSEITQMNSRKIKFSSKKNKGRDVYHEYFSLACQRVLLKKQNQLDSFLKYQNNRNFAIDYYGLNLINSFYAPKKISAFLRGVSTQKFIQNIAQWDLEEYEAAGGPMKYIANIIKQQELNHFLTRIKNGNIQQEKGVMKGSFVQQMYFPEANEPFIYQNPEKSFINERALSWSNLPKIIWLYWDSGFSNISNVPAEVYLCVQNLKRMAAPSGFQVREVNSSNLGQYLETNILQQIDFVITNAKMQIFPQTKSDIYRLALLYKYGGVYLDTATVAVQNFDWLVDIAKFPSKFIFNRFGELPDVLLFWNQHYGGHFEWEVSETYNTKYEWRLSIFNGFMAAVKGSEYVKEWMDLFQELLMKPIEQVFQIFGNCGISNFQWIHNSSHYLLAMDTGKCVLGRRQALIQSKSVQKWTNAMDYYKLWTINSFIGYFKLRFSLPSHTNYDNLNPKKVNSFLTRFSQQYAQGIIGKIHFLFKIIGQERPGMETFLLNNSDKLLSETHSQSVFRKFLYNQKYNKFQLKDSQVVLKE